jgi:hypothetical protein
MRGWRVATACRTAHQERRRRLAAAAAGVLLALPAASVAEEPSERRADAPVASERRVPEEEWAADLVDVLALERALPDHPKPADYFTLLCAEQVEREVVSGGRSAPVGPLFEASAELPVRHTSGPVRLVLSVPATALYTLSVEGEGRQRWVIDQEPVGHLDPTPLGVTWSSASIPLREGPHEITGVFGPEARADRVALTALRSLCIAPADGWRSGRPLTHGAKARTLVRAFGFERRLAPIGPPLEIEGEAYETVSAGGGKTNRRVKVAASHSVWATASDQPAELSWSLHLDEPAIVTLEARVLGEGPQLWSVDGRYRASVLPAGGRDVFMWSHVLTLPLGSGDHELRARIARHAGVDVIRATSRRSADADYVDVLHELGLEVSAAEALVTHEDAMASLSAPVFVELANTFERRIEGDPSDRPVVLVDEDPLPSGTARPLSPLLPAEL